MQVVTSVSSHIVCDPDIGGQTTDMAGEVDTDNNSDDKNSERKQEVKEEESEAEVSSLFALYLSRCLAAWGDRLWQFVGSIFMLSLDPDSLQLVAVYGLASCLTVLVFGASLGAIVDRTARMKMVTCAVIVQNVAVALTCALVAFYFKVNSRLKLTIIKHFP